MQELSNFDIALRTIEDIKEFRRNFIRVSKKMRNGRDPNIWRMDVYTTLFCGCLLLAGGMVALLASVYSCFTYVNGFLIISEVILSGCVVMLGICLMLRSLPKLVEAVAAEKDCETPFYYELEPVALQTASSCPLPSLQRRDLPPIPKDIGREYDPIVIDKV